MPFRVEPSKDVRVRADLAMLCNKRGVMDAAEIGVDRGTFAAEFMERWMGYTMLLIDPYEPYDNMPWDREADRLMAVCRLAKYGDRVRFLKMRSPESATRLHSEWRLQFVYIDGCHRYESVLSDVEAWYHRIDAGGILAGHDWVEGNGVQKAVKEFAGLEDLTIYHTHEGGCPRSWYMEKRK